MEPSSCSNRHSLELDAGNSTTRRNGFDRGGRSRVVFLPLGCHAIAARHRADRERLAGRRREARWPEEALAGKKTTPYRNPTRGSSPALPERKSTHTTVTKCTALGPASLHAREACALRTCAPRAPMKRCLLLNQVSHILCPVHPAFYVTAHAHSHPQSASSRCVVS